MPPFNWELARRRDPRPDPHLKLDADRQKLVAVERLRGHPMSFTAAELNKDPDGAREHADEIQRHLDADLKLCLWAADALPADDRHKSLQRAEDEHKNASTWLSIHTGEAFSTRPPGRRRIGRSSQR
jgi:hypothetical protein